RPAGAPATSRSRAKAARRSARKSTNGSASPTRSPSSWRADMSLLKGLAARARSLFASGASEACMEEEFRFHLTMETERLIALGVPPDEARRRAFVAFGGVDQHREAM